MTTPAPTLTSRLRRVLPALALAGIAVPATSGCAFLVATVADKAKKTTVNMDKYDVQKTTIGLRQQEKMICPGKPVQMAIFAEAVKKKSKKKKVKQLQTWDGDPDRANRIGKMGFDKFEFTSAEGTVDENGYFQPNPDVLATAASGFTISTKYKPQAEKFSFESEYQPFYSCITSAGAAGAMGSMGSQGSSGATGKAGSSGSSEKAGGDAGDGGSAGNGTNGSDGAAGPTLTAYATKVKTPFYDELVVVRLTGDTEDTILFEPSVGVVLSAAGGAGGSGGSGGTGGGGGRGGSGYVGGKGGAGGSGGSGGIGGNGGAGGNLSLVYDANFPELASIITLDVAGGPAGMAGSAGAGGSGGSGGSPQGEGATAGPDGASGADGTEGQGGAPGPDGTASAEAGSVDELFSDLPEGIERL